MDDDDVHKDLKYAEISNWGSKICDRTILKSIPRDVKADSYECRTIDLFYCKFMCMYSVYVYVYKI